jgi:hypothetical protein
MKTGRNEMTRNAKQTNTQRATTTRNVVVDVATTKRNAKSRETPTIVLKTIHDDIMRDNKTSTLTTKKMRVRLRASPIMRAIHVANASWIFTQSQYDDVRAMFDASYAQRIAKRAKRDASKRVAPSRDVVAQTNVETNDA